MRPVKLKFKGINSFSEQTEIDFERLTRNGIFGIFGDTGSGKSTILDCINFALYGKVERSKEKLDIINYRSDCAEVNFEFDILTEGKRNRYTVERSIRRKSGIHKAMLYENESCIADNASSVTKKITAILGVDAEDFRKCIALPQGEFSQFVKSQPSDRIALIERLFSLYKYGDRLKERLKLRENETEMSYGAVTAKLGLYNDVSDEILKTLEDSIGDYRKQTEVLARESALADKEYDRLRALEEKRTELDDIQNRLSLLKAKKSQMDELRTGLKAAPVCKAVVETLNEITAQEKKLSEINANIAETQHSIQLLNNKLSQLNAVAEERDFDNEIAACIALTAGYSASNGKTEKLSFLENKLKEKRKEYGVKSEELNLLNKRLAEAESVLKQSEIKLSECGTKNLEQLINVNFKGAFLKEQFASTLDYFAGLNGQINFFKDDSELYGFISRELKNQIEIYRDKVCQVKDFSLEQSQKLLKNIQSADEEREKLSAEVNRNSLAVSEAKTAVSDCNRELKLIQRDGEELRKQSDEIREELFKIFGDVKDYAFAERENLNNLAKLKREKSQLSADIQTANNDLNVLTSRLAVKQTEKNSITADIARQKKKLNELLGQSGFKTIDECKTVAAEFSKYSDAEKALEEYDSKVISHSARCAELQKIKGIKEFSRELLVESEQLKKAKSSELSQLRERLAVVESELKKAIIRLKEKEVLIQELTAVEKERNLIAQLKDLTKGNKFMEYIANEYLYDISLLASSTLLNLTDGRYFLTYTDTFYAGDNFNCGNLRGVNTLSGGETFLVSLSLALALSQTICASMKSIEFFFLDEGFGTLDGTLVDTVLNALEKLKSSRFTIGIISHVEELKHRIDNKIIVNKATENCGSTVNICC